ncbi:hypothetical protein [Streptomyces sp. DT117]|uniref:hypothetical protein n=1 Tax=Streptomyces sp. DT117 TaxID=3393422 RepID=UPI003CE7524B
MSRMIGKSCPGGPGGRNCHCCGQAPGKDRKVARRKVKRSERNTWKRNLRTA